MSPYGGEIVSKTMRRRFDSFHTHQTLINYMKKKNTNSNKSITSPKKIEGAFEGTVDQFLEHCSQLDVNMSEEEVDAQEKETCLAYIMKTENVSRDEALELYNMIALDEVKNAVDKLVDEGLLEIQGYDERGEPLFGATELGKTVAEEIENRNKKKNG